MTITVHLITFGASAVQFPIDAPGLCRVFVEPLRTNTHISYVGTAAVTNTGSGIGVIKELAQPPVATLPCDTFEVENGKSEDSVYPGQLWGHGTTGESLKVSYYQN